MNEFETFGFEIKERGGEATVTVLDNILDRLQKIQKLQNGGIGVKTQAKSTTTRRRSSAEVKDMKTLNQNVLLVSQSLQQMNTNLKTSLSLLQSMAATSQKVKGSNLTKDFQSWSKTGQLSRPVQKWNIQEGNLKVYRTAKKNLQVQTELGNSNYRAVRSQQLLNQAERKRIDNELKLALGLKKVNEQQKKNNLTQKESIKGLAAYSLRLTTVIAAARKLAAFTSSAIKESASYIENLNLFAVTFGETYKENAQWALDLANNLGLASSEAIRFTGLFKQLSTAIGNTAETGDAMSKVLTQFGYDLASFYNIDVTSAMEKLQAGIYSGQTKPLRSIGIDVTYQSIDNLLETNAALAKFNTSSKQLDQSQKAIARLIIALQSGSNAFGDMQETIGSLANQMRVTEAALANFKLAVGDLVNEPLAEALVYVNGFLQGITQVIRAFKPLKIDDKDNMISTLGADAEETNEALDETQKRLAGFDKFNVLQTSGTKSDLSITEALTKELEKQMEIYEAQTTSISAVAEEMANYAKQVRDFFIVVDEDGNFVAWTTQAKLLGTTLAAVGSVLLVGMFAKGITSFIGGASSMVSSIRTIIGGLQQIQLNGALATTSLQKFTVGMQYLGVAVGAATMSFVLFNSILSGLEGDAKKTVSWIMTIVGALGAVLGVVLAIKGGLKGGLLGATVAGLGVGALLAGIKGLTIDAKADGGFSNANLIMTHENGVREWVGRQGSSSAIVNDSQMSDIMRMAVARGVYEANMASESTQASGGVIHNHIYLDGKEIYESVTDTAQRYGKKWANA